MTYTVTEGQCLADVALAQYGDIQGLFWLLDDNPDLAGPWDRLRGGQVLELRAGAINSRTVTYLTDWGGPLATVDEEDQPVGIGYFKLEEYQVRDG